MRYVSAGKAAEFLREGEVGIAPTETVVGLIAGEAGLSQLSGIKDRDPGKKPIALLCSSAEEAFALAREVPALARLLADRFWPGPLTLVLEAIGGGTVGVRVPDHSVVQEVLAAYGGPIFATSANFSGEPAPRSLEEVDPAVRAAVRFAVRGEPGSGEASAVVDLSRGQVRLLRPTKSFGEKELSRMATPPGET